MRNRIGSSVLPLRPFLTLFESPLALREYMQLEEVARKGLMSQIGECLYLLRLTIFFVVFVQRSALRGQNLLK